MASINSQRATKEGSEMILECGLQIDCYTPPTKKVMFFDEKLFAIIVIVDGISRPNL